MKENLELKSLTELKDDLVEEIMKIWDYDIIHFTNEEAMQTIGRLIKEIQKR